MLRRVRLRVHALFRRSELDRGIEDELRIHIENETARNMQRGMSEEDAVFAARRDCGNVARLQEQMRASFGLDWLLNVGQDVRYALRSFVRTPGFTLTVVLTIGLGLGLNTSVFTIFNAYVLRPFAVRDPYSLYELTLLNRVGTRHMLSWRQYQQVRDRQNPFSDAVAFRFVSARISDRPAFGHLVSENYFRTLGVDAALGRTLGPEDVSTGAIMLGYRAWQARFGSDPAIVGKTVLVQGYPMQVVGVARAGFGGISEVPVDFFAPLTALKQLDEAADPFGVSESEMLRVIGRVRPEVSLTQARSALLVWARDVTAGRAASDRASSIELTSAATSIALSPEALLFLSPVLAAFILVLLIACANVANMMLARGLARQREIGIRLALGAGRARLVRQLLTESVLLAVPAALAGFLISRGTIGLALRLMLTTMPAEIVPYLRVIPLPPDPRVLAFMLLCAVGAAIAFGLAPALQATRPNIVEATRGDFDTAFRPSRLRNALVVVQITVCVLLLVCSGVLLRSVVRLQQIDLGMNTQNVLTLGFQERSHASVLERIRAQRAVTKVAAASVLPMDGMFPRAPFVAQGSSVTVRASYDFVSTSFFDVLEIPIVRGRGFSAVEEKERAPVAVISQAAAAALWPHGDAVGQTLVLKTDDWQRPQDRLARLQTIHVIGIARNAVAGVLLFGSDQPVVYFPTHLDAEAGGTGPDGGMHNSATVFVMKVSGDSEKVRKELEADLSTTVPGGEKFLYKLNALVAGNLYPFRGAYWVSCALGVIALLLTVTGIYGVLSYLVAQRIREIGIRMALGASARAIVGLVLRNSIRLAAVGIGLGAVLALGVSRAFASNLLRIETFDPLAYAGALAVVVVACLAASLIPSVRAARIRPMVALRRD